MHTTGTEHLKTYLSQHIETIDSSSQHEQQQQQGSGAGLTQVQLSVFVV